MGLMRDERGNAYAEAVVMLPVFILVWASMLFVREGYGDAVEAGAVTRQVGWSHALSGCSYDANGFVQAENVSPTGPLGAVAAVLRQLQTVLRTIPYLNRYLPGGDWGAGLSTDEFRYSHTRPVRLPTPLGGGVALAGHHMQLSCNETPRNVDIDPLVRIAYAIFGGLR